MQQASFLYILSEHPLSPRNAAKVILNAKEALGSKGSAQTNIYSHNEYRCLSSVHVSLALIK